MTQPNSTPAGQFQEPTDEELRRTIPRNKRRLEFRVGIFVLIGIASVIVALFLLTDPSTFRGRYRIYTVVEDAGGIRHGDPVQMRGVNIGRILSFSMDPEGVRITLEIEGQWEVPVGSHARLVAGGLLGGRTAQIVEGTGPEPLRAGAEIPGESLDGLLDMPAELGEDAQAVLGRIQDLLAEPTLEAIQGSARELQGLLAQLSHLAEAQGAEIARLTATLNRSAEGIEEAAGSGESLAKAVARADSALLAVNRTSEVLHRASTSLETILRRMESGEGTLGQLSTNRALFDNLNAAAESILLLADDLREHPERYVRIEIF